MGAPTQNDVLFSNIAVQNKLVTAEQIHECVALLEKLKSGAGLGHVLLRKGYISEAHFKAISAHLVTLQQTAAGGAQATPSQSGQPQVFSSLDVSRLGFLKLVGRPIVDYLGQARRLGASDFHFQTDSAPFIRLHGQLVYLNHPPLRADETELRIRDILDESERARFDERGQIDFAVDTPHGRYRAHALRHRRGVDAIFRVVPARVPTLGDLHLPDVLRRLTTFHQGLVLITGPAGSGKSSTMAALLDIINQEQHDHIVTVEDPIEIVIPSKNCNVSQRQIGAHTQDFHTALRSAMRADPDYIAIGELRDLETVSMALEAAETGHLVFGTLHTTSAVRSLDRLIDTFPSREREQARIAIAESIRGVISQQLIERADGMGREPALEIMFATPAVVSLIREKKTNQLPAVLQTGIGQGMLAMDDSIADLLKRGVISRASAQLHAENPERLS